MPFVDESKVTEWTNRLKSYFALLTHKHDASDITSGTLTVSQGGTGATDAATARTNLAVPSTTDLAHIESSIAYVESTTARTNHAAGDYFMLGNVLMRATSAIATGETINASKAVPATVQAQIDTLRDSVSSLIMTRAYNLWDGTTGTPYTIAANGNIAVTKNVAVSGYKPLGIVQSSFAENGFAASMTFSQVNETTGNTTMVWHNFKSEQVSSKLLIVVLYAKAL